MMPTPSEQEDDRQAEHDKRLGRSEEIRVLAKRIAHPPDAERPPLILPDRPPSRAHVQATRGRKLGEPGGELGRIAWAEHLVACKAGGIDPDREAARGGLGYAELCLLLGHEPTTWEPWK